MTPWFSRVRNLLVEAPRQGKLAYCLLRDERVPKAPKAALLAALGLIVSPLDLPAWIPFVGEVDMLALSLLAVKVFVEACPGDLVREHEQALAEGASRFDRDWRGATELARTGAERAFERWRLRRSA